LPDIIGNFSALGCLCYRNVQIDIYILTYLLGRLFICREILSISVENTEAVGKHN